MTQESVCMFNKFGFCKFGNYCFRNHENRICENGECQVHGCTFRHPRKCRFFMEFSYCKFGSYCKFSHQTLRTLETSKEIDDLKEEINQLKDKIKEKEKDIQTKEMQIKSIEENFEKERKKIEQEELEKFETVINEWHVTQMLFDSFKEKMTYKYGYDSNEETSEDENVEESEKLECDLCSFKGKTPGGLKTHIRRKHREK